MLRYFFAYHHFIASVIVADIDHLPYQSADDEQDAAVHARNRVVFLFYLHSQAIFIFLLGLNVKEVWFVE